MKRLTHSGQILVLLAAFVLLLAACTPPATAPDTARSPTEKSPETAMVIGIATAAIPIKVFMAKPPLSSGSSNRSATDRG